MEQQKKVLHKGKHTLLPKEDRPVRGNSYHVSMQGNPLYIATVVEYSGGCWATVQFEEAVGTLPSDPMFTAGSQFQIKVAQYEFQGVERG